MVFIAVLMTDVPETWM